VAATPPPLFAVGRVARAHGVRGKVLVAPFNAGSEGLEAVKVLWLGPRGKPEQARRHDVVHAERVSLGYLVALRGIEGRDAAEALRGSEVCVERSELPALEGGEVYTADLVGCTAFDRQGRALGPIEGLEQAGPNELLQVRLPQGLVLVPLALVLEAAPEAKRVVVEVPEGLFEAQLAPAGGKEDALEAARAAQEEAEAGETGPVPDEREGAGPALAALQDPQGK
jgi:16S rRNA processing protein RimM